MSEFINLNNEPNIKYIKNCNICNNSSFKSINNFEKFYLNKCRRCNFIFSKRIPAIDEIEKCYQAYNRNNKLPPSSLSNIEKVVIDHVNKFKPSNVLDIGCGHGDYLNFYKKYGIETFFTEYDIDLINKLKKNHKYIEGGIFPESEKKFDLVILSEVIEHTHESNKLIKTVNNLQNKNGIVYITTPNYASLEAKIYNTNYSIFSYPEHLSYFTLQSIDKLLNNNGYRKIYNYTENISLYRFIEFITKKKYRKANPDEEAEKLYSNQLSDKIQISAKKSGLIFLKHFISRILRLIGLGNTIKATYIKL